MSDSWKKGSLPEAKQVKDVAHHEDSLTQSERFIKAALELGTDDDPERFKERVRMLTGAQQKLPAAKKTQ